MRATGAGRQDPDKEVDEMGQLFDIIQQHMDAQPYGVSQRKIAERLGVSPTTLKNWREPRELIEKKHLEAISALTGVPYLRVLDALLHDIGYMSSPEPRDTERGAAG
jgi:hypothetical protein